MKPRKPQHRQTPRANARAARLLVIAGTRPEIIKLAPVLGALTAAGVEPRLCVTGQHDELARSALATFGLTPDRAMSVMRPGQSLAELNRRSIVALAAVIASERPDWVIVQGDTSSALAGAIAAREANVPIAHVEAGLRTHDRRAPFPEEINRTLISTLAALHFAPTETAAQNLRAEGIAADAIETTGNTIVDALRQVRRQHGDAPRGRAPVSHAVSRTLTSQLVIATLHRRENAGAPMAEIIAALRALSAMPGIEMLVPVHPGVPRALFAPLGARANVRVRAPLDYAGFIAALSQSALVITDSGGIQEEACALGIPTLIARSGTERPEVLAAGTARIVGTARQDIIAAATPLLSDPDAHARMAQASAALGDGHAAARIAARLCREVDAGRAYRARA